MHISNDMPPPVQITILYMRPAGPSVWSGCICSRVTRSQELYSTVQCFVIKAYQSNSFERKRSCTKRYVYRKLKPSTSSMVSWLPPLENGGVKDGLDCSYCMTIRPWRVVLVKRICVPHRVDEVTDKLSTP